MAVRKLCRQDGQVRSILGWLVDICAVLADDNAVIRGRHSGGESGSGDGDGGNKMHFLY